MKCALWLNRQKITDASEISENLDTASLRGYFVAGSLLDWLRAHGGEEYAEKLAALSPDDDRLNEKIAEIFGGTPTPVKRFGEGAPTESALGFCAMSSYGLPDSFVMPASFRAPNSFFTAFGAGSGAFALGSGYGAFTLGSGYGALGSFIGYGSGGAYLEFAALWELLQSFGSFSSMSFGSFGFHEWEWEWFYRLYTEQYGSFALSSFTSGGLFGQAWLLALLSGGAFGSFSFGSFAFGSMFYNIFSLFGNYGSFTGPGSFGSLGSFAAPAFNAPPAFPALDEYDRIMLETLLKCPLDGFGYGIHNI